MAVSSFFCFTDLLWQELTLILPFPLPLASVDPISPSCSLRRLPLSGMCGNLRRIFLPGSSTDSYVSFYFSRTNSVRFLAFSTYQNGKLTPEVPFLFFDPQSSCAGLTWLTAASPDTTHPKPSKHYLVFSPCPPMAGHSSNTSCVIRTLLPHPIPSSDQWSAYIRT